MEDYQIAGILFALATCGAVLKEFWTAFGGPDLRPRSFVYADPSPVIDAEKYGDPVELDDALPFPALQDNDKREMTESHSGKVIVSEIEEESPERLTPYRAWVLTNQQTGQTKEVTSRSTWDGFKGKKVNE